MSLSHVQNVGTATANTSNTDLVLTFSQDVPAGDALIAYVSWGQNNGSSEIDVITPGRFTIADDNDNTWVVAAYGEAGGLAGGSSDNSGTVVIVTCTVENAITAGDTVTFTYFAAMSNKAVSVEQFTGLTKHHLVPVQQLCIDGENTSTPSSLSLSGLASGQEYLYVHACSVWNDDGSNTYTQDSDYTTITAASSSTNTIRGGYRIASISSDTVQISNSAVQKIKQAFVAFRESDQPGLRWVWDSLAGSASAISINFTDTMQVGDILVVMASPGNVNYWPSSENSVNGLSGRITHGGGTDTAQLFWKRMQTTGETISLADFGSSNCMTAFCLYGAHPDLPPFDIVSAGMDTDTSTTATLPGGTPAEDDTSFIFFLSHGIDATTGQLSSLTNSNLSELVELLDYDSNLSNGVGFGLGWGFQKGTAGAIGNTTWTLASSGEEKGYTVLALRSSVRTQTAPSIEVIAQGRSTAAPTLSWAAGTVAADDLIVVQWESSDDPATPTGYTEISNSPQHETGASTYCSVFYKVADGTETGVTVTDSGNHNMINVYRVRGADPSDPINTDAGGTNGTAGTTFSMGALTTDANNCLVVVFSSDSKDYLQGRANYMTNSDLDGGWLDSSNKLQALGDTAGADGDGGGACAFAGTMATAGAISSSSMNYYFADSGSTTVAWVSVAFNPVPSTPAATFKQQAVAV